MGIKRDDRDGRQDWVLRGFRRYDAPVSVVVRDHAQIPDDQAIMICIAMGWPDEVFPANPVVSQHKDLDESARFVGFKQ